MVIASAQFVLPGGTRQPNSSVMHAERSLFSDDGPEKVEARIEESITRVCMYASLARWERGAA
jgi:hypothetical protein